MRRQAVVDPATVHQVFGTLWIVYLKRLVGLNALRVRLHKGHLIQRTEKWHLILSQLFLSSLSLSCHEYFPCVWAKENLYISAL